MIAIAYFLIVFNSKYFEQVSKQCEKNHSFIKLLYHAAPLYIRVMIIPIVLSVLCLGIASTTTNAFIICIFIIEAIEFVVLFFVGHFITHAYT